MNFYDIPKEAYALLGAALGAIAAIAGTFVTQFFARSIERERVHSARFQQIATDFSAAAHALLWITWPATEGALTKAMIDKYHNEIHVLLPKIVGAHVAISAIDADLANLTAHLVDRVHDVDEKIARACLHWEGDANACTKELAAAYNDALAIDSAVYKQMAEMVRVKRRTPFRPLTTTLSLPGKEMRKRG